MHVADVVVVVVVVVVFKPDSASITTSESYCGSLSVVEEVVWLPTEFFAVIEI